MSSFMERQMNITLGQQSPHYEKLMDVETPYCLLNEEQCALMALVCDKISPSMIRSESFYEDYFKAVEHAQFLMPGNGDIASRQILVLLAMYAGITEE
jgi:hypothetical protein